MADQPLHQEIESYVDEIPAKILDRIPPSEKLQEAKIHHQRMVKLAHECLEAAEARPEPATATATVTGDW